MTTTAQKEQSKVESLVEEISSYTQETQWDQYSIQEILMLLKDQYPTYSTFKYLGQGDLSLVLQSTKNSIEQVALKIKKYQQKSENLRKKESQLLNLAFESEYFAKVKEVFYLRVEVEEQEEELLKQSEQQKKGLDQFYLYEVIEMEVCESNLRKQLQYCRNSQIQLSDNQKEILAVQMLDSLNFLHSKCIFHRDIKLENFLVSKNTSEGVPLILKLSDKRRQSSDLNEEYLYSGKKTLDSTPLEAFGGGYQKQSDVFALGIVFLELDNYAILDYSKLSIIEYIREKGIEALNSHEINQKSLIFQAAKIFLDPEYQKRKSVIEVLAMFMAKKELQNTPLYSVITSSNIHSLVIVSINDCSINQQSANHPPQQLKLKELTSAITSLQGLQKFTLFTLFEQGRSGLLFSAFNLKCQRECALKIFSAQNKSFILNQILIFRKCHSPYIAKFYGYEFFKDQNNTPFVVFEFEKCHCTLTHFLEQDTPQQQISSERKTRLAVQIIDSISLLHRQNVLHGDVKLENFLISEDEEGREIIKLIFDQAGMLNPDQYFDQKQRKGDLKEHSNCLCLGEGSPAYQTPEKYHFKNKPNTKLSDGFSAGICLLFLDNFKSFKSELACKQSQLLLQFQQPSKDYLYLFNVESKIYEWAKLLLVFNPIKRWFPQEIVDKIINPPTLLYSKWNNKLPLEKEYYQAPCLFLKDLKYSEIEDLIISQPAFSQLKSLQIMNIQMPAKIQLFQFISLLSSLSSLNLDFKSNKLNSLKVVNLFKGISNLFSLSSLQINLSENLIGNEGEENAFQDLSSLTSLQSLILNLNYNKLTSLGVGDLLKSISNLSSLSSLQIDLCSNLIRKQDEENIFQDFSLLTSLSSLNLNFSSNKLTSIGLSNILKLISKLSSLSSLQINLYNNFIGNGDEENPFQNLSTLSSLSSLNLDFSNNKLTSSRVVNLFKGISNLSSLSSLQINLSENSIGNEGEENIFSDLSSLTLLQSLNLNFGNNKLTCLGVGHILKCISNLSSLSTLQINLYKNTVGNEGEENIYQDLPSLPSLQSFNLNLSQNKLTNLGIRNLLKGISNLSSLSSLKINLFDNLIGNGGEENIFEDLSTLFSLQLLYLNFQCNQLTSFEVGNLLKRILKFSFLLSLQIDLAGNQITSKNEYKLLDYFKNEFDFIKNKELDFFNFD